MRASLILFSLLLLIVSPIYSQSDTIPRLKALKVDPFGAISGQYTVSYERQLGVSTSYQVSIGLYFEKITDGDDGDYDKYRGGLVSVEYRYYLFKKTLKGFYGAPLLEFGKLWVVDQDNQRVSINVLVGGLKAGHQWRLDDRDKGDFIFDIGGSVGYGIGNSNNSSRILAAGLIPGFYFSVGYAF